MQISKRAYFYAIALLILGAALVFLFGSDAQYKEISTIGKDVKSFEDLSDRFVSLAQEKGGEYAFEVLKRADLPLQTDLHLLGHFVGDELYKQKGVEGVSLCTHDFRNACSHTMVIGALIEFGEGALSDVRDACMNAPGGSGAYTMCYHGFGHGVLAYNGYDFPSTVKLCELTGTSEYNQREYIECVGGAVMELLSGGGHDKELWEEKRKEYISDTNPLSLCQADFMTDQLRPICYTYITPLLFEFDGGNLGFPREKEFEQAFSYCDKIPAHLQEERETCFGGVGKELVVLAQDRDVRDIASISDANLQKVDRWCELAPHEEARSACVVHAVQSLFWGGENDRNAAVRFCSLMEEGFKQEACFAELTSAVGYYIEDETYYRAYCDDVPDGASKESCENILLGS